MIVNDFLKKVSLRLGDEARVTYSNKELISALNDAITQLSLERIASSDATMVKEISVTPGTTAVPLLWQCSARFAEEKSKNFYILTIVLAAAGCFIGLALPFNKLVNIIYGINGYVGILLLAFIVVKDVRTRFAK